VKRSAEKLLEYSLSFKGKKGPRIDYKLKRYEDKPTLDTLKVIKTSMSFALAGIDLPTLSFGIIESFAEFVSNMVDEITKDYDIDGVGFNGSLFESPNLINKFYTITKKNYKIFLNNEFTLDDMNLGYGIINAACAK
jgi:hydrogenase maturation factor HypF (carbamoyltransferase family)